MQKYWQIPARTRATFVAILLLPWTAWAQPASQKAKAEVAAQGLAAAAQAEAAPVSVAPSSAAAEVAAPSQGERPKTLATAINLAAQQKMPESFGAKGQIVLGGASSLNLHGFHAQLHDAKGDLFQLDFSPMAGRFVTRHLFVGGILPIDFVKEKNAWSAAVGVGPTMAVNIPIRSHFGLFPRGSVAYQFGRAKSTLNEVQTKVDAHTVYLNLHLDAVVHLTHHLSVLAGPYATWSVYTHQAGAKAPYQTYYGLNVALLGWI